MGEAEQKDKEKADKAEKRVKAKEKAFKQNGNEKAEKALIAAEKKSKTAEHVFAAAQDELEKEEGNEEENTEKEEKQVGHINKAEAQERGAKRRSLAKKNVEMQGKHLKKAKMQAKMAAKLISENPSPKNMKLMEKDSKQKDEVKTKVEKSKKRE